MSAPSPSARPIFDPVDTSFDPNDVTGKDDVESPSLSSSNARARFEFEPGKSRDGTKVLMVEWEDDVSTTDVKGDWEISWEGKRTVLPAREQAPEDGELGATATQAGKRGVLHTIWAKKRLQVLQKEIENESKDNVEGIGFEMAVAEVAWIEQNFGVAAKAGSGGGGPAQGAMASVNLNNPSSPRSPGGGRLMDKLKGLKVGTSPQDLQVGRKEGADSQQSNYQNPLSPETSDVAVGSFGSFAAIKGAPHSSPLAKGSQSPRSPQRKTAAQRPAGAVAPPRQPAGTTGMSSLNAVAIGDTSTFTGEPSEDAHDDLFALPLSPRSPETTKSPFSFGAQDTVRYMKGEKAR
ncbi:hypothetical protein LTR37_010343 [Vermiconidia calcicola]|uniref:Uncharacterized protein n=1 Tax=Vermiconidia calcicola TaxID=1690605 RepID=A0ACC3N5Q7_9PEZI|nr:hypothetical protein LTR37_010343 [Vermiconidia calcicola]